jgi:hypothetical protein
MTEFTVRLAHRPGMLAFLTRQIAEAGVHIEALAAYGVDGDGVVRLMVDDEVMARKIFARDNLDWEERKVLTTTLSHSSAALADMANGLADAGANIEAMYLLRSSAEGLEFAVVVDDEATEGQLAV